MASVHDVRNEPDPHHVAARLRALLEPALHSTGLTAVAARLGVKALEHPTSIDHLLAQAGFRGRRVEAPPRARADREFDEVDQDHRRAD